MTRQKQRKTRREIWRDTATPAGVVRVNAEALAPYNSYGTPLFVQRGYYEDVRFTCSGCGSREVWRAAQQKWWYEVAKGNVCSGAKLCRACRRREQARRDEARRVHLEGIARRRDRGPGH
ncbi:MAG TPA: zinc-ribbon domain containing protein [Burkholderiales bacterium]|nr:zinc-ribbon domain containing protein [Burkholderiales bacterium]